MRPAPLHTHAPHPRPADQSGGQVLFHGTPRWQRRASTLGQTTSKQQRPAGGSAPQSTLTTLTIRHLMPISGRYRGDMGWGARGRLTQYKAVDAEDLDDEQAGQDQERNASEPAQCLGILGAVPRQPTSALSSISPIIVWRVLRQFTPHVHVRRAPGHGCASLLSNASAGCGIWHARPRTSGGDEPGQDGSQPAPVDEVEKGPEHPSQGGRHSRYYHPRPQKVWHQACSP